MSSEINIKKKISIKEENVLITSDVNSINFTGSGVIASSTNNDVTVNITGGSGTTTYYLNQTVNQTPYKEFSSIPTSAAEQTIVTSVASGTTATIQSFQTATGVPGTTNIPGGLWSFYLHFSGTLSDTWNIFTEVYKRNLAGVETLLLTTDQLSTSSLTGSPTMILTDGVFPASTVLTTDRIVVKVKVTNTDSTTNSITFYTEGSTNYSVGLTTLNQTIPTGVVTNVTGTAPIASSGGITPAISISQATASSDGYLSSGDFNTFSAKQNALGFTPEDVANKSTNTSLGTSDTLYPTQNAVKTYADNLLGNANALVYKGTIDCSANPNYPAADAGWMYIASVAGKIGGASGVDVEVGDMIICNTDGSPSGNQATVGNNWNIIQKNIIGAVSGPASSVNNNVAFFDGTTGKIIKDSGITLSGTNTGDQTLSGLGGVPTSRTITINGTTQDLSADRTWTIPTDLIVNSTVINSGTAGRVFFQNASNQLSQSANLFWDNSNNRLGINTATPTVDLDVLGQGRFHTSTTNQLIVSNPTYANGRLRINIPDNFTFQLIDNDGYGITHSPSNTGINARQTNISLWTQSGNTTTLRFGGQDINPTVARTRSIIQPVQSSTTLFSPTSGTAVDYSFQNPSNSSFAPSSGTASYTQVELRPTFNTTSTYSGIGRGLYYNPILTSVVGLTHRAIETTTGDVIFGSTSGNVAIGSSSPGARLDVRAADNLSNPVFRVQNSTGTQNLYTQDGTGNVIWRNNAGNRFLSWDANTVLQIGAVGNQSININAESTVVSRITTTSDQLLLGVSTHAFVQYKNGNFQIEQATGIIQTSGQGGLSLKNGTAPTASSADRFIQYSADITADNAAPHFRTENGSIIKLYQNTAVTNPQGIADALTNLGVLASSTIVPSGYTLTLGHSSNTMLRNTTWNIGGLTYAVPSSTNAVSRRVAVPKKGVIKKVSIMTNVNGVSSSGSPSPTFQLRNETQNVNTLITTTNLYFGAAPFATNNLYTISASVNEGDEICVQAIIGNVVTEPTQVVMLITLWIEEN
jgi:hypothetical protein